MASLTYTMNLIHPNTVGERQFRKWPFSPMIPAAEHTSPFRRLDAAPEDSRGYRIAPPAPYWALSRHPITVEALDRYNNVTLYSKIRNTTVDLKLMWLYKQIIKYNN